MRITLHKEHGVNPSMTVCFYCHNESGIALFGANRGKEAPRYCMPSMEPCRDCETKMATHVGLIATTPDQFEKINKDRRAWEIETLHMRERQRPPFIPQFERSLKAVIWLTDRVIKEVFNGPPMEQCLRIRWTLVETDALLQLMANFGQPIEDDMIAPGYLSLNRELVDKCQEHGHQVARHNKETDNESERRPDTGDADTEPV